MTAYVDGDPGVQIEMHIFTGSRAPWDHIGGNAPQFDGLPTGMMGAVRT